LRAREADTQSEFVVYVTDQLRRWAAVSARRLFGGHGVYRGAIMFAIVSRDTLYFRTDDINRPEFEAAGMGPFRVGRSDGGRIALSYHEVPSDVLEDAELLAPWAERAFAAALRRAEAKAAHAKKKRGNRRRPQPLKQRKG
jgi:DNA transformation protein